MSLEVRVRRQARVDPADAALWYEAQSQGLGAAFIDEVERTFGRIADRPTTYRVRQRREDEELYP